MPGIPTIRRELNWVHIAQRFPVRIDIDYPQPANAFRVGASAVTIILGHCQRLARTVAVLTRAEYPSTVAIESPRPLAERLDLDQSERLSASSIRRAGVRRYDGAQKWLNGSACAPGSRNMRTKTTGSETRKLYPNLKEDMLRVVIVDPGKVLLPELSESLGRYAEKQLGRRGVEVRLMTEVDGYDGKEMVLSDCTKIAARTLIWTVGITPPSLLPSPPCRLERGRVVANDCLQVPDSPGFRSYKRKFASPLTGCSTSSSRRTSSNCRLYARRR
jgi:Pyridine nucleotide-disulphide oxidoreductase